nr:MULTISPECIES: YlqD family protein [unclassified Brevibacillus]
MRTVQVKVIMTEASRAALVEQYRQQIRRRQEEWEQWQFQAKKLLADARKRSPEALEFVQERIAREERQRKEKLEQLQFQLRQAENLPEGSEIEYATVQSPVQIRVGDVWDEIMSGTEIMVKDGRICEIRQSARQ